MTAKTILIIDDDPKLVSFLKLLLQDNGYQTLEAFDGQQGMALVRSERPDLVLLDITMPEKSGVRFYRELRDDEALRGLPVVMVTGVAAEFERFIHTRRQVPPPEGYFSKPVDRQALLDTIANILAS